MSAHSRGGLAAEVKRPSELSAGERAAWLGLMAAVPSLRRAFFAPGFAEACEQAHGRARVAVLRRGGETVGFFPFQYPSAWHRRLGLAERIGGDERTQIGICRAKRLPGVVDVLSFDEAIGSRPVAHDIRADAHGISPVLVLGAKPWEGCRVIPA